MSQYCKQKNNILYFIPLTELFDILCIFNQASDSETFIDSY